LKGVVAIKIASALVIGIS